LRNRSCGCLFALLALEPFHFFLMALFFLFLLVFSLLLLGLAPLFFLLLSITLLLLFVLGALASLFGFIVRVLVCQRGRGADPY